MSIRQVKMQVIKGIDFLQPDGRMSMDNMITSSHLLSMDQNGRAFYDKLEQCPDIVRKYVERVINLDVVDESLKVLNQMIVERLSEEAGRYEV